MNKKNLKKRSSTRINFFYKSFISNALLLFLPILIMGSYSLFKSFSDNTKAIERSMMQTLQQCEHTMNSLYSQVDNALLFFSSNPQVKLQLNKAFTEESLSLTSLNNVKNLSLYFQNLMYTNLYIDEIYVYYKNDYQRIFKASAGKVQTSPKLSDSDLFLDLNTSPEKDFWIEVRNANTKSQFAGNKELLIFNQYIYHHSAYRPIGALVFEFNLSKLGLLFDSLLQFDGQKIYLFDSDHNLLYTNSSASNINHELKSLFPLISMKTNQQSLNTTSIDGTACKSVVLRSTRTNGLTYVTSTPTKEIYRSTKNLSTTYIILTCCAIGLSVLLAFYKSSREYRYLNVILDIFSNPSAATLPQYTDYMPRSTSNPFEYVIMNIIRLFMQQDYLKIQASEREYKIQTLKMQALQHQINPHFLYNALNSIYWETVKMSGSENNCSAMISNLSLIIRYSLSDPLEDVTVREEIDYLEKYISIMKVRYPDKFNVVFSIDPACESCHLKKMLLQPLVENAIYHGIGEKEQTGNIRIGIRSSKNGLICFVLDNGVGMNKDTLSRLEKQLNSSDDIVKTHLGLANTNLRLKLAYGNTARLHIKTKENTFTLIYFFVHAN